MTWKWQKTFEEGQKIEDKFAEMAKSRGYIVEYSTKEQDINEHWDLSISAEEKTYKVDVKGKRASDRSGKTVSTITWLEIHGVNKGNQGWLFGAKSDYIAFELDNGFILFKTEDLRQYCIKYVELIVVKNPHDAINKLYRRDGRLDVLTKVRIKEDLMDKIKKYFVWENIK